MKNNIKSLISGIIIGINACSAWAGDGDLEEWELNKIDCIMDIVRAKAFTLTEKHIKEDPEYLEVENYLFNLIKEQGIRYPYARQWTKFSYFGRETTIANEVEDLKRLLVLSNQDLPEDDYMLFLVGHLVNKECKDEFLTFIDNEEHLRKYAFRIIRTYYYLAKSKDPADPLKPLSDFIEKENFDKIKNKIDNDNNTPFDLAAMKGDLELAEMMIKQLEDKTNKIITSFNKAMCRHNKMYIKTLLNVSEKVLDTDGIEKVKECIKPWVYFIVKSHNTEQVYLWWECLEDKAINFTKKDLAHLLYRAVMNGDLEITMSLLVYLNDTYADFVKENGEKLRHCAEMPNKLDRAKELIYSFEDDATDIIKEDAHILLCDAVKQNNTKMIVSLLKTLGNKVVANIVKEDAYELLYMAVQQNNTEIVKLLLKYYKDKVKEYGQELLDFAREKGNQKIIEILTSYKSSVEDREEEMRPDSLVGFGNFSHLLQHVHF